MTDHSKSVLETVRDQLARILNAKLELAVYDRIRAKTPLQAGLEQMVGQFARGDRDARRDLFALLKLIQLNEIRHPSDDLGGAELQLLEQSVVDLYVIQRAKELGLVATDQAINLDSNTDSSHAK